MAGSITKSKRPVKRTAGTPTNGPSAAHVAALTNGRQAWECGECSSHNDLRQVWCLACGAGLRPDLSSVERLLVRVLATDDEGQQALESLAEQGVSDDVLLSQISTILDVCRQDECALGCEDGSIAWHVSEDRRPAFWLGVSSPPARKAADLQGKTLAAAVRDIWWIGKGPAGNGRESRVESREPEAANGKAWTVPLIHIKPLHESYSSDILDKGKISRPVEIGGRFWVCTGAVHHPADPETGERRSELRVYEAIPAAQWKGAALDARTTDFTPKKAAQMRLNPQGFYHGLQVHSGKGLYVLSGPERTVDCQGMLDGPPAKKSQQKGTEETETASPLPQFTPVEEKARTAKSARPAKKKRSSKRQASENTPALDSSPSTLDSALPAGYRLDVPLDQIVPSPFQPRTAFDPEKLKQLGESLRLHGQTTDCLVREVSRDESRETRAGKGAKPSGSPLSALDSRLFELIGGERRLRAAELVELKTLACRVIVADDARARELAVFDNLDREDLSELDRIRAYAGLLDHGVYATQAELAEAIGIEPASLSNLLRILKLPEEWLDLISQERLPVTHARYVIPWADRPAVMERLLEYASECDDDLPRIDDWKNLMTRCAVVESRPLSGKHYILLSGEQYATWRTVRLSKKDKEREADLDVVEVKGHGKRAFNVALWEELQTAGEARAAARAEKADAKGSGKTSTKAGAKKVTPAEAKRNAERNLIAWQKRLWIYKIGWLQRRVIERVQALDFTGGGDDERVVQLLLYFVEFGEGRAHVSDALSLKGGRFGGPDRDKTWAALAGSGNKVWAVAREAVCQWISLDAFAWRSPVDDGAVVEMAATFDVDLQREWLPEEAFLQLLNKEQLGELRTEWKLADLGGRKKSELIEETLIEVDGRTKLCPKMLAKAKRPVGATW